MDEETAISDTNSLYVFKALLPHAQFSLVRGCAHPLPLERPGPVLEAILRGGRA